MISKNGGGQHFPQGPRAPSSASSKAPSDQEQATLVARHRQDTQIQQDPQAHPLSQAPVIASSSDNLLNPVHNVPSSYVYSLPNIPSNTCSRNYVPPNTFHHPVPYRSSFSSYNNPAFSTMNLPLGPPPPVPPTPRSRPFNRPPYPQFNHSQPNYIPPQPAYNYFLPTYNHPQPPFHHSQPAFHHSQPVSSFLPPVYQNPPIHPPTMYQIPPVIAPLPSPSPTLSKTLPTVTHIPVLTSKHDFSTWDEGVNSLIRANNLLGHILDPSAFVDPTHPDLAPNPIPVLSTTSSVREIEASNRWWSEDNIVQHILFSRLGSIPRGLLPASNITTPTALSIYKTLLQYYGTCNFADCAELLNSLHNSSCTTGRVSEFVLKLLCLRSTSYSRLQHSSR